MWQAAPESRPKTLAAPLKEPRLLFPEYIPPQPATKGHHSLQVFNDIKIILLFDLEETCMAIAVPYGNIRDFVPGTLS
ncbi:hypothetical protein AVEN_171572-1 [Araneus ventricosus]|uniref:Uncharacterized protein n=1 Tax=Araneus ventricosus TaxID=182803 RepID=A0A4Y2E7F8_ARAVE|nr:hypothetical protein AVEN_171572-1 [Araneus ventricosus]